jgi:hypothetical protein
MFSWKMLPDPDPAAQINTAGILRNPGITSQKLLFQRGVFQTRIAGDSGKLKCSPNMAKKFLFERAVCSVFVAGAWNSFRRVWKIYVAFFEQTKLNFIPIFVQRSPTLESTDCQKAV